MNSLICWLYTLR